MAPSRHSDTDPNVGVLPVVYGAMNFMNFVMLPFVASARAAADASGVWIAANAPVKSAPASRTRRSSNRFSLLEYVEAEIHTSTPVRISPTNSTPTGSQNGHRRHCAVARCAPGLVFALCPPRRPSVGAGHRATLGHRDPGIIA